MDELHEVKSVLDGLVETIAVSQEEKLAASAEPSADTSKASYGPSTAKLRTRGRKRLLQPREPERSSKRIKHNKKRVQFSGVKVYYFERAQGFSVVPSSGGSSLGMDTSHHADRNFTISEHREHSKQETMQKSVERHLALRSEVHRRRAHSLSKFCDSQTDDHSVESLPNEEVPIVVDESESDESEDEDIKYAEYHMSDGEYDEDEVTIPDDEYYFQPLGSGARKLLFKSAGVPTDNSDKAENDIIRASRTTCGCSCEGNCEPETCQCAIDNIKCQIDRPGFPCTCSATSCLNPEGRVEFNEQRVRVHHQQTMMRLRATKTKGTKDTEISSPMHIRFCEDSQTTTSYLSTPPPLIYQQIGNEQNEDSTPECPIKKYPVTPTYNIRRARLDLLNKQTIPLNSNNSNVNNPELENVDEEDTFPSTPSLLGSSTAKSGSPS